jgi:hypothetical protein
MFMASTVSVSFPSSLSRRPVLGNSVFSLQSVATGSSTPINTTKNTTKQTVPINNTIPTSYTVGEKLLALYVNRTQAVNFANATANSPLIKRYIRKTSNFGSGGAVIAIGNGQVRWSGEPLLKYYTDNGRLIPIVGLGFRPVTLYAVYEVVLTRDKHRTQYNQALLDYDRKRYSALGVTNYIPWL